MTAERAVVLVILVVFAERAVVLVILVVFAIWVVERLTP